MQNVENILNILPGGWHELKLKDYQKLLDVTIDEKDEFDGLYTTENNLLNVVSKLADVPSKQLEEMPFASLMKLLNKVSFTQAEPSKKWKSSIKWKKLDEISYDNYISYLQLAKQPLHNLHTIIKLFTKTELTEEEILELDMEDVHTGFFLLRKILNKSIKTMFKKSVIQLMWNRIKTAWHNLTRFRKRKKGLSKG